MGGSLRMLSFNVLSDFLFFRTPIYTLKMASNLFYGEIRLTKLKVQPFLIGISMGGTLRMSIFKILSDFFVFLGPIIVTKNGIKFVLR
jgi:hypothetical protein